MDTALPQKQAPAPGGAHKRAHNTGFAGLVLFQGVNKICIKRLNAIFAKGFKQDFHISIKF